MEGTPHIPGGRAVLFSGGAKSAPSTDRDEIVADVNIGKLHPEAYQAMVVFSDLATQAARDAGLDAKLIELIKLRASQINGCAYCLRLHARDAAKAGETSERLAVLAAWWESQYFSSVERAALHLVEQITHISDRGASPTPRDVTPDALTDEQVSAVSWMAIAINSWNRVAITSHYPVAPTR